MSIGIKKQITISKIADNALKELMEKEMSVWTSPYIEKLILEEYKRSI